MICSELLQNLGITPNYTGYRQTQSAVALVQRQPDALLLVTKCLYPEVAKEFGVTWKAVERNIRSVITLAWTRNPQLLQGLVVYPMPAKPSAAEFIAILASATTAVEQTANPTPFS